MGRDVRLCVLTAPEQRCVDDIPDATLKTLTVTGSDGESAAVDAPLSPERTLSVWGTTTPPPPSTYATSTPDGFTLHPLPPPPPGTSTPFHRAVATSTTLIAGAQATTTPHRAVVPTDATWATVAGSTASPHGHVVVFDDRGRTLADGRAPLIPGANPVIAATMVDGYSARYHVEVTRTERALADNADDAEVAGQDFGSGSDHVAQSFEVGRNEPIAAIRVWFHAVPENAAVTAALYVPDPMNTDNPGTKRTDLELAGEALRPGMNTFKMPDEAALTPGRYFLYLTVVGGADAGLVLQAGADSERAKLFGWSIADGLRRSGGAGNWSGSATPFGMAVMAATGVRSDAELTSLELTDGAGNPIVLDPPFASATTQYAKTVPFRIAQVTVVPTRADDNAVLEWLDGDDNPIEDGDPDTDGHQIGLGIGEKTVRLRLTAEDKVTVRTYTLVLTRTENDVPAFAEWVYAAAISIPGRPSTSRTVRSRLSKRNPRRFMPVSILRWHDTVTPRRAAASLSARAAKGDDTVGVSPWVNTPSRSLMPRAPKTRIGARMPPSRRVTASSMSAQASMAAPACSRARATGTAPCP